MPGCSATASALSKIRTCAREGAFLAIRGVTIARPGPRPRPASAGRGLRCCTVLVDGHRVNACLTLSVGLEGAEVTMIEGLADGELPPLQQAFIDEDAFQCGYCAPGQIVSGVGCIKEGHTGSPKGSSSLCQQPSAWKNRGPGVLDGVQKAWLHRVRRPVSPKAHRRACRANGPCRGSWSWQSVPSRSGGMCCAS